MRVTARAPDWCRAGGVRQLEYSATRRLEHDRRPLSDRLAKRVIGDRPITDRLTGGPAVAAKGKLSGRWAITFRMTRPVKRPMRVGVAPTDASQKPNLEPGPALVVKGLLAAVRDHDAGALADLVPDRDAKD